MNNEIKEKELIAQVISTETGEIIEDLYEGDKIIHSKNEEKDEQNNKLIYNFNEGVPFVKLYLGVNKMRKYLTPGEFTIAISLADFVCYEDCIVREGGHHNGKILTISELAEEMEMNYEALRKILSSLKKKGVIAISETGCRDNPKILTKCIIVNPYIFTKGININKTLTGIFNNSNWND